MILQSINFYISIALSKIRCKRFPKIKLKEKIATNFVTIQPAFLIGKDFVKNSSIPLKNLAK
ncbi:hypothetical protein D7D53_00170 [Streptococcus gwangjuense]|uniref:Uncharacterized protein n=1 Tax=Streptococcus gwangjuensis TaxID=1433513 RepID=A0A387AY65_9STRE|nr:hypothetical protein D7D53_00170 [Streptococcus gwangjuense]